jgi:hypothetical protein
MKIKNLLLLALFLVIGLTACSGSPLPAVSPDKLQITEHVGTQQLASSTLTDPAEIQKLYTALAGLPGVPIFQECPAIGGPSYDLIFYKAGKVVLTAQADRGGCGTVMLPQNDKRQPDDHFWSLLTQTMQSTITQ